LRRRHSDPGRLRAPSRSICKVCGCRACALGISLIRSMPLSAFDAVLSFVLRCSGWLSKQYLLQSHARHLVVYKGSSQVLASIYMVSMLRVKITIPVKRCRHLGKVGLQNATHPLRDPLRQVALIHMPRPPRHKRSGISGIDDLLDVEVIRRPHRVHQPPVLRVKL